MASALAHPVHSAVSRRRKPESHTPDWQRAHGRAAKGARQKCATCHSAPFCSSCHGTALPHPRGFRAGHDELAAQTPALCAKCRDQYDRPKSHDAGDFGKTHGAQSKGKEALCALCHGERTPFVRSDSCSRCHGLEMPHPKGFRAKHSDLSAKSPQLCVHCHAPKDCRKCHDEYSPPASHDAADYGKTHGAQSTGREVFCAQCHGKTGCADCHKQENVTLPPPAK